MQSSMSRLESRESTSSTISQSDDLEIHKIDIFKVRAYKMQASKISWMRICTVSRCESFIKMLDGIESMRERMSANNVTVSRLVENSGRSQEHVRYVELRQFTRSLFFSLLILIFLECSWIELGEWAIVTIVSPALSFALRVNVYLLFSAKRIRYE